MQLVQRLLSLHDLLSALFQCPRLGCCLLQLFFQISNDCAVLPLHMQSQWLNRILSCYNKHQAESSNADASLAIGAAPRSQPAVLPSEPRPPQWPAQLHES